MKKSTFSLYYVLHYLPGLLLAGLLLHACGSARTVWADPLPELSARRFEKELVLMTAEYDKEVTQRQAESNPYLSERLILKSTDSKLDPDEYGAVDAIQDRNGTYILQFESPGEARAAAHALSREDSTVYVEPDGYLFACGFSTVLDEALWGSSAKVIGADQYAQSLAGTTGTVEVAVLDTGISFTSPKLAGKLDTARAKSFATFEGDLLNVDQSQDSSTETKARHGTHVAGVIAQCTESLPNIRILPVRVLNNKGAGSVSQVANGIRYAADQGAAVINMSLSGKLPIGGATIRETIDYAVSRGTIVVGVSGNNGTDVSAYTPGNIEECVVVGAVNGNDSSYPRWSGSNYGSTVDIVAPGVNVYGTVWENLSDGYNSLTGTSMASPHAAAAAAMIKLAHGSYGPAEIEHVLQQSVIDLGESGKDKYYGHGMIDLNSLLGNEAAAQIVVERISDLPSGITLDDKAAVESAREAYDALTSDQKPYVTNLSVLTNAEEKIRKLEEDIEAAETVMERISDLPSEITLADRAAVESVRAAYDALTGDQKALVTNLSVLTCAEAKIKQQAEQNSEYKNSKPAANVTYRVPLKKKQKTKVLKVTGLADGDYVVKWTSSARKKVKVTGRADGTCVIKAGSRTGNASVTALTASGKKVVFKLRVQNGKVKTKKLKTSKKTIRIGVGESIKLPVTRYPVTSVQKITYTSKNKAAARVAGDGTVTGAAPGTARIVVRSGNAKLTFTVITG